MISNFILSLLTGLITSLSSVISSLGSALTSVGSYVSDLISGVFGYLVFVSPIMDPSVLFWSVATLLTLSIAALVWRIANWVFNKIPLIAGFGFAG